MKRISIADWIYEKIRSAIAIVQDGDTATRTIASGKYVIWKGVLCKAKAAIPSGTTLSSTNLEAVPDGGLNELHSDVETLNSKLTPQSATITAGQKTSISVSSCFKIGQLVVFSVVVSTTDTVVGNDTIAVFPYKAKARVDFVAQLTGGTGGLSQDSRSVTILANSDTMIMPVNAAIANGWAVWCAGVYLTDD